jgi:NYN domain/OST-HTH/LOTUS domain
MNDRNATAATKLALLIDGDNVSATYMAVIMREAAKHGAVAVRRIYGQFKAGKMKSWMKHVEAFDMTPVNVSPLTKGKNATDMKLVIEAMDMLYGRQLDGICIASSDGDFTPLAARIRANALAVYGFGAKKAPAGYKAEFDRFYECDTLLAAEKKEEKAPASAKPATPVAPKAAAADKAPARRRTRRKKPASGAAATKAPELPAKAGKPEVPLAEVMKAIDAAMDSNGRAHMRTVGNRLTRAIPRFAAKDYGFKTITDMVRALPGIELTKEGNESYVRRKTG